MRVILVTGSDTGVGKTRVVGTLARMLCEDGSRVQIVKVVETGRDGPGDAALARSLAAGRAEAFTLASFSEAIAPAAAAAAAGRRLSLPELVAETTALPDCDWRICEGAGGIATPLDDLGRDWADFAAAIGAAACVIVVADRLGAINQGRLASLRAAEAGLRAGVWLNAASTPEAAVAASTRSGLRSAGVDIWAEQGPGAVLPADPESARRALLNCGREAVAAPEAASRDGHDSWLGRCREALAERDRRKLRRQLKVAEPRVGELNLADNDYLDLARDPAVAAAVAAAACERTSASASPLVSGWGEPHARLLDALCSWHRFPCGLLWSSGYAANSAVLGNLPRPGEPALADRLIHHSMISGLLRSGARIRRYPHLDLGRLERWLGEETGRGGPVFVATESLFSMDGDHPDLGRLAELREKHGFCLVLDEAHALGWYGPEGAGLARAAGVEGSVDVFVGTLGKTLASGGAYTLFRDAAVRDYLANVAGEFVYSTSLPPPSVAGAEAALRRVRELSPGQPEWRARSIAFRAALRAAGWAAPDGDSPVVPVRLDDEDAALSLVESLRASGIRAAAVRPPTVPAGTSRIRFSLKRTFATGDIERVVGAMAEWRGRR